MKQKFLDAYMRTAEIFAELSTAQRLHVGSIIVKDDRIISIGYNGMPSGWDNNCEDDVYDRETGRDLLVTKPEVLHAETNAIAKVAKSTNSTEGASMFITHAPCLECSKIIAQTGIEKVFYKHIYRTNNGLEFLRKSDIDCIQT